LVADTRLNPSGLVVQLLPSRNSALTGRSFGPIFKLKEAELEEAELEEAELEEAELEEAELEEAECCRWFWWS
jgi:hypothetical protein